MKNVEEFLNLKDKLNVFKNPELIEKYFEIGLRVYNPNDDSVFFYLEKTEYAELEKYLNDNEKTELIMMQSIVNIPKLEIIKNIENDDVKLEFLEKNEGNNAFQIIELLSDEKKEEIIKSDDLIKKYKISQDECVDIIKSLSDERKEKIIFDEELSQKLNLSSYKIADIVSEMNDYNNKLRIMNERKFAVNEYALIIKSLPQNVKEKVIINNPYKITKSFIMGIIANMEANDSINFLKNNKQFLKKEKITIFDIVRHYNTTVEKQLAFAKNIEEFDISEGEKKKIIAGLLNETKEKLDLSVLDNKYEKYAKLKLEDSKETQEIMEDGKIRIISDSTRKDYILPDLNSDLSIYKDLDELLTVVPQIDLKNDKDRQRFDELCKVCPDMHINDLLGLGCSSVKEYIEGEKWINSILNELHSDWNQIQKMAFIHTSIGKRLSYTPEQGTEVENAFEERPLWKIITNKNGVCNGIAQLEQYMFQRCGIESEIIGCEEHSYLKAKNIEIPTKDGIKVGDTLLDPTWDLAWSKFNTRLHYFCRDYKEIRKYDIMDDDFDSKIHKNEELENADLIELDDENLRKIATSIGIADNTGRFLGARLMDARFLADILCKDIDANINLKFSLLKNYCPDFAECINSSMKIMSGLFFSKNEYFDYKECVVSRVFDKTDEKKKAVLFTYFDLDEKGKRFYYADKEKGEFIQLSQEDFENRFDCYNSDKKNNKQLWEQENEIQEQLEMNSEKVVEGDER